VQGEERSLEVDREVEGEVEGEVETNATEKVKLNFLPFPN
jgi:hypothetical protein